MAGLIGSHATVVSSGAERKKHYNITTTTTSLTGLQYTPTKVHVYHNGVRLVDGTDYTATNGTSITLTNAAENGDDVVVISYATFQTSDTVSAANGGTFAGDVTFSGAFTSQGIDDNATSTAMTLDSSGNVGIGTTSVPSEARAIVSGGRFYVNSQDQYSVLLQNSGTSGGFIGTTGGNIINFFNSSGTEAMRIDAARDIQIGKTDGSQNTQGIILNSYGTIRANSQAAEALHLIRSTAGNIARFYHNNTTLVGNINVTSSSTAYNTSSDYRLKENVVDLTGATARLKQLEPKRFNFIADADTTVDGFIAHEVQTVVPEAITGTHNEVDDEGNPVYQGIDQSKLVPLLTAALQEAIAKIETLETEMTSVKARLDALEAN